MMNPNLELEEVVADSISVFFLGVPNAELTQWVLNDIRKWMNRNQIVFYQP